MRFFGNMKALFSELKAPLNNLHSHTYVASFSYNFNFHVHFVSLNIKLLHLKE